MEPGLPPSYIDAVAIKTAFRHLDRSGCAFPKKFSISPNSTGSSIKWILGEYRHQPIFAISRREPRSGNKPDVILHDGISLNDPTLASFRSLEGTPRTWKVRLPPSDAEPDVGFEIVSAGNDWRAQKRPVLKFSVATEVRREREDFEWRSSNNDNIRGLLGGQSLGWKLVRITKDAFTDQIRGPRGAWPKTNNGAEIVAVFSSGSGLLVGDDWKFAFVGTGANSVLGSRWEIMTVITALLILDTTIRTNPEIG
ncbi:hypothetical protein TruAng_011431 [Truncatella angustata]|nr:hypothetical protein TruAng_011431 [Truncatella angustata]